MPTTTQLEILDLRHFTSAQLRPLLEDEARRWNQRLHWDYTRATEMLLDYLDGRILPGYVALAEGRALGYGFAVLEANKAVIGDVYAFHEGAGLANPLCETLLHHLIEMLQATPGVDRIEAQLLMFPTGALAQPFLARGFRAIPRLFMGANLPLTGTASIRAETRLPAGLRLLPWQDSFYDAAAALIHRAYLGHVDSTINDQYQTVAGSLRFLHNIVRFPGCGTFDAGNSWALLAPASGKEPGRLEGLLLCSRVRPDVGHITQLCLSPSLRGLGLGRALLQRCTAEFTRRGLRGLTLTVTEANTEARRLYEEYGFTTQHQFEAMVWNADT